MIWIDRPKQNCRQLANWYEKILFRLGLISGKEDNITKKEFETILLNKAGKKLT